MTVLKNYFLFLMAFGLVLSACGGEGITNRPNSRHYEFCVACKEEYKGKGVRLHTPDVREENLFDDVLNLNGLAKRPYFICRAKRLRGNTAAYATSKVINGRRVKYVVYDSEYFGDIDGIEALFVIAHEIGHVVTPSHPDDTQHDRENYADYFAGHTMYRMGISLWSALEQASTETPATDMHPSGVETQGAIRDGWKTAERVSKKYSRL